VTRHHHRAVFDESGKQIGTENIPFTPEEEATRDAEEQAFADYLPMKEWLQAMVKSDNSFTRKDEDMIDDLGLTPTGRTKERYDAKKALRAQKP